MSLAATPFSLTCRVSNAASFASGYLDACACNRGLCPLQAVASAPLWDEEPGTVIGMISASDFIHVLRRLRHRQASVCCHGMMAGCLGLSRIRHDLCESACHSSHNASKACPPCTSVGSTRMSCDSQAMPACHSVTTGGNQMSEAEMDQHTIRGLREEATQEGRSPKALVSLHPGDHLSTVLQKLFRNRCSMAPVLTGPATSVFQHARTICTCKKSGSGRSALVDMLTGRHMRRLYDGCFILQQSSILRGDC